MNATLRLLVAGDCFLPPGVALPVLGPKLRQLLGSTTWACANCEGALRPDNAVPLPKAGPALMQSPEGLHWLVGQGFSIQNLANNHVMDWGAAGLHSTRALLHRRGAPTLGAGPARLQAEAPLWLEHEGRRLALFAVAEAQFGVLDDGTEDGAGYAWVGSPALESRIADARRSADAVVVLVHAGLEDTALPLPEWRVRYRQLIAAGADAVVAHHPHVPQGVELHAGKPIFYSLGNFAMLRAGAHAGPGLLALLELDAKGRISSQVLPVALQAGQLELLDEAEASALLKELDRPLHEDYESAVAALCRARLRGDYAHFARQASLDAWLRPLLERTGLSRLPPVRRWLERKSLLWTHNLQIESHRYTVLRGLASERRTGGPAQ